MSVVQNYLDAAPAAGISPGGFTNGELNNQMAAWIDTRWFWTLLILTLCGEFLLPCLLARKDPAYRPGTMAVSVLGRRGGPVARVYRLWLAWLGIWLFDHCRRLRRRRGAGLPVAGGGIGRVPGRLRPGRRYPGRPVSHRAHQRSVGSLCPDPRHCLCPGLFSPCCSYPSGGRCWRWRQTPRLWRGPALPPWGWRWYSSRCLSSRTKTASRHGCGP